MKTVRDSLAKLLVLTGALLAHPLVVMAAEHHSEGSHSGGSHGEAEAGPASLIWPAINFFLYLSLMVYLYKRFVRPSLVTRAAVFEQHLQKAAGVLEDAERELGRAEHRLREIKTEQDDIRRRLREDGEHLAARLIEQAQDTAAAMKRDVARRVEREASQARSEVRQMVVQRATAIARQTLERGISPDQDRRLRDETLKALNIG